MRNLRMIALAALAVTAAPAAASGLKSGVESATEFCLTYLETGQQSDVLLKDGFKPKRKSFQKKFGRNIVLGHKNDVHVTAKVQQKRRKCMVTVGNGELREYQKIVAKTAKAEGYHNGTIRDDRGRKKSVMQNGSTAAHIYGKSSASYGSVSSLLVFTREN